MNRYFTASLLILFVFPCICAATEFDRPWQDTTLAIILDPYHANRLNFERVQTDLRVAGIIHKATQGLSLIDRKYAGRRLQAKNRGFLWGSYHLLTNANIPHQIEHYLATVGIQSDETYALDVECMTRSNNCADPSYEVSVSEVKEAMRLIKVRIGNFPMLYTNDSNKAIIAAELSQNAEFSDVRLWYARFRTNIASSFPDAFWESYTIWQFSSEINCAPPPHPCPYRVSGTDYDMDLNIYAGSVSELRAMPPLSG